MARDKWVLNRCGMTVLAIAMAYWTLEAEEGMLEEGVEGNKKFVKKCTK